MFTPGRVFLQQQLSKSLQMAPFESLYGRRCRSPLNWSEPGERVIFGPDLVTEAEEKVRIIQNHLKTAQSRQKSYADKRRRPLEFEVGNWAYLRVSPMKGVHRFGVKGKLAPRYIGPFRILQQCGSWPTSWICHHTSRLPTTCFMSRNSSDAYARHQKQ